MSLGILIYLLTLLSACSLERPKESVAVAAFKQDVRKTLAQLSSGLTDPVSTGNEAAVRSFLTDICHHGVMPASRPVTCSIGVLNTEGRLIASTSPQESSRPALNFSRYETVSKALDSGKTIQARFYDPDGSTTYVLLNPLQKEGHVVGLIVLAFSGQELSQTMGVTEEEFLVLDFNDRYFSGN